MQIYEVTALDSQELEMEGKKLFPDRQGARRLHRNLHIVASGQLITVFADIYLHTKVF